MGIADVDCTAAGKPLCEKYGVRGYPTIKYFNPPDEEGEDYKGGRTLADLKKFADAEKKHEALLKELQATYKGSMEGLEKLKEASAPKIKLLKAATPTAKPAETK